MRRNRIHLVPANTTNTVKPKKTMKSPMQKSPHLDVDHSVPSTSNPIQPQCVQDDNDITNRLLDKDEINIAKSRYEPPLKQLKRLI